LKGEKGKMDTANEKSHPTAEAPKNGKSGAFGNQPAQGGTVNRFGEGHKQHEERELGE